ncbi:primase-helicase family protein [Flavobacterium anhuiense]|uniref:primase-helicase family protein n=1 Tax=Flavobacterium anhuiense TaxID=459526 RepID=UPI003D9524B5
MKDQYVRVGTSYYKKSLYPTLFGDPIEILVQWSPELIRQDHGKNFLSNIEKYDGFVCIPEHRSNHYKKRVQDYYNIYHAISKEPKEGSVANTLKFISHIFGDQAEMGLDYIQLLYLKPAQILPILCVVSKERSTGKTTLLKWLKELFEYNMTFLTNNDFTSQFNSDWTNRLVIAIDEVLFKTDELTERIKYLSTTNTHKTEAKGKDKKEGHFFGKFILASNNETSFIKIDSEEIRFWVRKLHPFENEDVNLLNKLIAEIPAFLHFLSTRKLSTENKSRMWFTAQQIHTKALQNLIKHNSSKNEIVVANVLINIMDSVDVDEVQFCFSDLLNFLNKYKIKYDASEIKKIIKQNWKLKQQPNSNQYQKITVTNDLDFYQNLAKGRYYSISRKFLEQNFDELMTR